MWTAVVVVLFMVWVMKSMSRGGNGAAQLEPQHTAEIARLREEVDALTAQVTRLQDEQTFMMRLVEAGNPSAGALPPPDAAEPTINPEKS
jgi:cell division protein FtsB